MLHDVLGDQETDGKPVVFWSNADSRSRANAACILACYMVLIQNWPPHLALAPIAQMDPPCMPFRDAGYSQADYGLTVQDVVYGVWKAKEEKLCGLNNFSLEEYVNAPRTLCDLILTISSGMRDTREWTWVTSTGSHPPSSPLPRLSTNQHTSSDLVTRNMRLFLVPSPPWKPLNYPDPSRMSLLTSTRGISVWSCVSTLNSTRHLTSLP